MNRLEYDDYLDFAVEVEDRFEKLQEESTDAEINDIAIIAKYYDMKNIIRELVTVGFDIHSIDLEDADWDGYDDEYILSLSPWDAEFGEIWCEKMKNGG
jgi:hypothetical protein